MDADEYQWRALTTAMPLDSTREALLYCALGLTGECGEVAEIVKKWAYHGHPLDKRALMKELGDAGWYYAVMCHKLGFTLSEVMESNLEKLRARYPNGFDPERSRNREDDK